MAERKQVFVFGEIHGAEGNVEYMKGALNALREKGVKNFAVELPEDAQDAFSDRVAGGRVGALAGGDMNAGNGARLYGIGSYVALAAHARGLGMEVHCVDAPRSPKGKEVERIAKADGRFNSGRIGEERYVEEVQEQFFKRNEHMANKVSQLSGDTVLLTGMFHTGGKGSIEGRLREKGMDVVAVDLYPSGPNPTAELFERNENPAVDMKVKNLAGGPTSADIESMVGRLRGIGAHDGALGAKGGGGVAENGISVGPLRRGGLPSRPKDVDRAVTW